MSVFRASDKMIEDVIRQLRNQNLISEEAIFSGDFTDGRNLVSYRDYDFLEFLGTKKYEKEVVEQALSFLSSELGILSEQSLYEEEFLTHRKEVKKNFSGSWSSITPAMERLIFNLSALRKPDVMIEVGSFWGNSMAWFCGPALIPSSRFSPIRMIGLEKDMHAHNQSLLNFNKVFENHKVELECVDGLEYLQNFNGKIDMLYLEAKPKDHEDLYIPFLEAAYPKLNSGAWVIAHDVTRFSLRQGLAKYLEKVRDKTYFQKSICFDVDNFGLELSIR